VSWAETHSPSFTARHADADGDDVIGVLELLEGVRERLASSFPAVPEHLSVVLHPSAAQLDVAQPVVPVLRRLTAPAARRYLAGWFTAREVHVLAPRALAGRASTVPGSQEMLLLTPAALYAQLVAGLSNPALPPPLRPASLVRYTRHAWLAAGAGQWFSGQTAHARPAIARRLREGEEPAFPPGIRDAQLLGGSVFDLLAREEGEDAAVRLAIEPPGEMRRALERAFRGRSFEHSQGAWRTHLARLAAA
jgi:hypothetical protein